MGTTNKFEVAKVGDMVIYNGFLHESLFNYEKDFIKTNMKVGELYEIMRIEFNFGYTKIPWYRIIIEDIGTYWVPYACFDIEKSIKEKYDLR